MSTEGLKQIITSHINSEFHANEENNIDIFGNIKQIEESHILKTQMAYSKREILHPSRNSATGTRRSATA